MSSVGTAGRPPVDIGKVREFLVGDSPWLQNAAIGAIYKTSNNYGLASIPVWNELFEVAVNDKDWHSREVCQALVYKYLQNKLGTDELFYKMRAEVEKDHVKDVVGFFIAASMIAIRQGCCGEEPFDVLASLVEKDDEPTQMRDAIFLNIRRVFGASGEFKDVWGKMKQAIVRREAQKEISQLRNLHGLMEPQGNLKGRLQPRKPDVVRAEKVKKVVRA
ncbi:MAG: hypothetical protein GY852_03495 [bacterium]|nr:hypothetical protein [bacterium]